MAFNPNIPQPTDKLSQSQADILANFQGISPLVQTGVNPYIQFPVQGSVPSLSSGNDGFYNLNYSVTSLNELFIHKQTAAGTTEIPLTGSILSTVAAPVALSTGWTYLPSGILMRWGQGSGTGNVILTIVTPPGPAFNTILSVQLTPVSSTAGDVNIAVRLVSIISNTQINVYISPRTTTGLGTGNFTYLIIGY